MNQILQNGRREARTKSTKKDRETLRQFLANTVCDVVCSMKAHNMKKTNFEATVGWER